MLFTPALLFDSRANKLLEYEVRRPLSTADSTRWLHLSAPDEIGRQVELAYPGLAVREKFGPDRPAPWTHRYRFDRGLPVDLQSTLELLKTVLTLTPVDHVDVALAMDWYKRPDPALDPKSWPNRPIGERVHRGKYWWRSPFSQRAATAELVSTMVDLIP